MDTAQTEPARAPAVSLFYSYAHEDEPLRDELADHLKILERRGLVSAWHDRRIVPGQDWAGEIDRRLDAADLVLLLVSADFMASDYIHGVELRRAMERRSAEACEVVPILVRPLDLDPDDADAFPFLRLQALPPDLRPVTTWPNRDEAWTQVAKGLRATVRRLIAKRVAAGPAAAGAGPPEQGPAGGDVHLDRIVERLHRDVDAAAAARDGHRLGDDATRRLQADARALIDAPSPPRLLWVDDRPEGNARERAVLAGLQIEVVTATSTGEALDRLTRAAAAGDAFDLVVTDWSRPWDGPAAALRLLDALREAGWPLPVVLYHAAGDDDERRERAARAARAGAFGEAVRPDELLHLVRAVLAQAPPAAG